MLKRPGNDALVGFGQGQQICAELWVLHVETNFSSHPAALCPMSTHFRASQRLGDGGHYPAVGAKTADRLSDIV